MSIIKSIKQVLGLSATPAENHFWDGSVPNQLSLKRGTPEAPGATVLEVINGQISVAVPPGTIIDFAGAAAPVGYLACPTVPTDISRVTYPALFAAIGVTWGAGDGSTTFGMPYFPTGFAAVMSTVPGQNTPGSAQAHVHLISNPNSAASVGGAVLGASSATSGVNSASGNNMAAGMTVLKCVKV